MEAMGAMEAMGRKVLHPSGTPGWRSCSPGGLEGQVFGRPGFLSPHLSRAWPSGAESMQEQWELGAFAPFATLLAPRDGDRGGLQGQVGRPGFPPH